MYKPNDTVRVKTWEQVRRTLDSSNRLQGKDIYFSNAMERYCGKVLRVAFSHEDRVGVHNNTWSWHIDWIEPFELDNRRIENV